MQAARIGSALFLLLLIAPSSLAHEAGAKLEKESGEYLIELTYDTPIIQKGQDVEFHVSLIENAKSSNWHYAPFDSAWIQIRAQNGATFRQMVNTTSAGIITLHYPFTKDGTYVFSVRFLDGEEVKAEGHFPLTVGSAATSSEDSSKAIVMLLFVAALGVVLFVVWRRRKRQYAQHARRHSKR